MNAVELLAALQLPPGTRVDQRVPKKLLIESGASTTADKRLINESVEELRWLATIKPTTIGVPAVRDPQREYLEIAVLRLTLRVEGRGRRLAELVHRAVPYPVFLVSSGTNDLALSVVHKRRSQADATATVLDGSVVFANVSVTVDAAVRHAFVNSLALARQPHADLFALYQGWIESVEALLAARLTGMFALTSSPDGSAARRRALAECERLDSQMVSVRTAATKERQVARQVELNLELNRLRAEYSAARAKV